MSGSFRIAPDVRFRVIDDEVVVVRQGEGDVLVFNQVAARVIQLVGEGLTPQQIGDRAVDEFDAPEMVMLVVNANPANHTDGAPKVVLDIALDVPPAEETVSWVLIAGLLAATVVVLVLLLYMRQKGLKS